VNPADNEEDADARYRRWHSHDPFPEIPPALLNSADLQDYVAATGMITPFSPNDETLKPASYAVPLAGEVLYWEERFDEATGRLSQVEHSYRLRPGETLELAKNSIVYVTLEPVLRLPNYIAARFNLTIAEIYRGLLVGTGPLVDPGFVGRLHLPLHNYTSNTYTVTAGEAFVWMEFTKLSPNQQWSEPVAEPPRRGADFVGFPPKKLKRDRVVDYLKDHKSVTSSIPQLVGQAQESARIAADANERIRTISILAALGVFIAMAAVLVTIWFGLHEVGNEQGELRGELSRLRSSVAREHHQLQRSRRSAAGSSLSAGP
jgi:deoxycytidine triphosphate deaminase